MALRLFVAVEVPASVVAEISRAVEPLREQAPTLKWVRPEQYHLTLAFLGSVPDDQVEGVRGAVEAACAGFEAFALHLTGRLGTFRRSVLWAELAPSQTLQAVAAAVVAGLRPVVSLPDGDRPFSAHLTLARAPRGQRVDTALLHGALPAVTWNVPRLVLMQSQLSPKGSRYSVDTAFPLLPQVGA